MLISWLFCRRGGAAGNKLKMTLGLPVSVSQIPFQAATGKLID